MTKGIVAISERKAGDDLVVDDVLIFHQACWKQVKDQKKYKRFDHRLQKLAPDEECELCHKLIE